VQSRTTMATALGIDNRTFREQLTPEERKRFEAYVGEIFSRLGMDLTQIGTRTTPSRWLTALWDMTEGYDGDPKLGPSFHLQHYLRTCANFTAGISNSLRQAGHMWSPISQQHWMAW